MTAMTIQSMNELFHHALQDIYYAENQIAKTLSDMMDQATDAALVDNFEHHLEDTQEQIKRLDRVFRALGQTPKGVTCQAILGLIEESQETLREIRGRESARRSRPGLGSSDGTLRDHPLRHARGVGGPTRQRNRHGP